MTTITKQSSHAEIISYLKESNLSDIVEEFQANEIDGEDLFSLEMRDIYQMIPQFKLRKRFLSAWSAVTMVTFDINGVRCESPLAQQRPTSACIQPTVEYGKSSLSEQASGTSSSTEITSLPQTPRQVHASDNESNYSPSPTTSKKRKICHRIFDSDDEMNDFPAPEKENDPIKRKYSSGESKSAMCTPLRRSPRKLKSSTCGSSSPSTKKFKTMASPVVQQPSPTWLTDFCIPARWEPNVEKGLAKKMLDPPERNALIRQLCSTLLAHHPNPDTHERSHVALLLMQKYPFLKGSYKEGHQFWAKKMGERILNLRRRSSRNDRKKGAEEGTHLPKGKPGRKKKVLDFTDVPDIPDGETAETMEGQRKEIIKRCRRGINDMPGMKLLMDNTFPKRRRDILQDNARVWKILSEYPCLKDGKGIEMKNELGRIMDAANIGRQMKESWDAKKASVLGALQASKLGNVHKILAILEDCDPAQEREIENRCILTALPLELGEKQSFKHLPGQLFWEVISDDTGDDMAKSIADCKMPRLISSGGLQGMHSLCLAAEGMIVIKFKSQSILNAVFCLLAAFYIFNAEYPKAPSCGQTKNIFLFLEYLLLQKQSGSKMLPVGVENFLSKLKK